MARHYTPLIDREGLWKFQTATPLAGLNTKYLPQLNYNCRGRSISSSYSGTKIELTVSQHIVQGLFSGTFIRNVNEDGEVIMKSVREQFNNRVWSAFSRLIEKRYHRHISFSPAMPASFIGEESILTANGDLIFPLLAGDHFLGAIRVKQGASLASEERHSMQSIFNKVGSALLDASDSLNRMETDSPPEARKYSFNLIGGGIESRRKLALNIHDVLGGWSFVSWNDSGITDWSQADMENLATVTVFIPDVLELSPEERQKLISLRKLPISLQPNLIVGSSEALSQYATSQTLEQEFASLFSETSIFTEQLPKDYLRLKEVLEMLMDKEQNSAKVEQIFS